MKVKNENEMNYYFGLFRHETNLRKAYWRNIKIATAT